MLLWRRLPGEQRLCSYAPLLTCAWQHAPLVSRTMPEIALWANTEVGSPARTDMSMSRVNQLPCRMVTPLALTGVNADVALVRHR